jgi:hypothetical protein
MLRSRLFGTFVSVSFALQLALAGTGSTCVLPSGADQGASSAAHAGMAEMVLAGMNMDMSGKPFDEGDGTPSHGHDAGGAPCDQPGTPAACQVMASCAGGFVAIAAAGDGEASGAAAGISASVVATPASRTIEPELPPPRA